MTLPTGTITMNQVNVELGNSGTSLISLNETEVRALAGGATLAVVTPTYIGGTSQENSNANLTLSGLQSGDLVLFFSASDNVNRNTPGTGWTAIPGLGSQPDNDNNPDSAAFYIFSQGSSVEASGLNDSGVHVMIAFRGVDSNSPFSVNAVETLYAYSMPNPPTINTVDAGCMIVAVGLLDDDAVASSVTAPSGYTLAVVEDTVSSNCTVMTAYKVQTSSGGENPGTFGGSGNDTYKAQTIALKAAPSSSGPGQISMDDLRGKTGIYANNLEIWLDAGKSSSYSGSGTTWYDLANSYDGTLTNGVAYSSSNSGYLTFDGINDYVEVSGSGSINAPMSKSMTISVWLYFTKTGSWQGVFTKDTNTSNYWGLWISAQDYFAFVVPNGIFYSSGPKYSSTWYNVTLVQDANSSRKIYVNGTLESQRSFGFGNDNTGSQNYQIGRSASNNFGGRISHALLYENEALSSTQVAANFNLLKSRYGFS